MPVEPMKITETPRLSLEHATPEDAAFCFQLMNSKSWIEFIGDRGIHSTETAKVYICTNLMESYAKNGYGLYVMRLKEDLKPIGLCGLLKRSYLESPDIGFAVLPEYEGKGYTFEAARAILYYGTDHLKIHPILAITTDTNTRSRRLLTRIGMVESRRIHPDPGGQEFLVYTTM